MQRLLLKKNGSHFQNVLNDHISQLCHDLFYIRKKGPLEVKWSQITHDIVILILTSILRFTYNVNGTQINFPQNVDIYCTQGHSELIFRKYSCNFRLFSNFPVPLLSDFRISPSAEL